MHDDELLAALFQAHLDLRRSRRGEHRMPIAEAEHRLRVVERAAISRFGLARHVSRFAGFRRGAAAKLYDGRSRSDDELLADWHAARLALAEAEAGRGNVSPGKARHFLGKIERAAAVQFMGEHEERYAERYQRGRVAAE